MPVLLARPVPGTALLAAAAVAVFISLSPAAAQEAAEPTSQKAPPYLVVTLDGGLPAGNLVRVLTALADEKVPLRMRTVTLGPESRLCDILAQAKFPPSCGDYLAYLEKLNPQVKLFAPAPGTTITLPDVRIDVRSVERLYTRSPDTDVRLKALVKNWAPLNAKIMDSRPSEVDVAYERYTVELHPERTEEVTRAARLVAALRLKNTAIDVKGRTSAVKLFGDASEDARSDCEASDFLERLRGSTRKYLNWFDRDVDAARIPAAPAVAEVRIHILDTPVTLSMPNLDPRFAPGSLPIRCTWTYDRTKHHGNHLASIIASKENGTGFSGIEPTVRLKSFSIVDSSVDEVAEYIEREGGAPLSIVLVAAGFPVEHLVPPSEDWEILSLPDLDVRFQSPIARVVDQKKAFLVVAAGQRRRDEQSLELSATTNLFPQNLGDFPNVIVVAACGPCSRGKAELLKGMYRTDGRPKFVQVAAPGGEPIPGWTSETSMHAVAGTSQAAAYVTGVAAAMLARFPATYSGVGALKYRLQICSYPLPTVNRDFAVNRDANSLGVGVIDPAVCLLDPAKTWVKQGGAWKSLQAKGWTAKTEVIRGARRFPVANDTVFRVVRTPENRGPDEKLAFYVDRRDANEAQTEIDRGLGQIDLVRGKAAGAEWGLRLCDDSVLPLAQLEDVILPASSTECPQ